MYDYIKGPVIGTCNAESRVTVLAGSIGFAVVVPAPTYAELCEYNAEDTAELWLHHTVQPDQGKETLFGFLDRDQRALFRKIIKVHGAGPAVALRLLSGGTPADLRGLIARKDVKTLKKINGIGPKLAERLVAELKP